MMHLYALAIGFTLDLLIGDPKGFPHIVSGMGRLIAVLERSLRSAFPQTPKGELRGGAVLAALLPILSSGTAWGILYLFMLAHPLLGLAAESLLCWQCLALRSLRAHSMAVYTELEKGDLNSARTAVGMIVGRDTAQLDDADVTRAAVETVAENTSDGVIAPLLFLAIAAPLGVMYKAINTMDSMVGYKNEKYLYFGRAAARLDDAVNFIPARISALLMIVSAYLLGQDGANAWRIWRRDRRNHTSPNSANTEAACAGALHIRLGGDAYYFGRLVHKPAIGDNDRLIEHADIRRAGRLLYGTSCLCFLLCAAVKGLILWL
jgi:adenosylcobinamide-phosphate synthase